MSRLIDNAVSILSLPYVNYCMYAVKGWQMIDEKYGYRVKEAENGFYIDFGCYPTKNKDYRIFLHLAVQEEVGTLYVLGKELANTSELTLCNRIIRALGLDSTLRTRKGIVQAKTGFRTQKWWKVGFIALIGYRDSNNHFHF